MHIFCSPTRCKHFLLFIYLKKTEEIFRLIISCGCCVWQSSVAVLCMPYLSVLIFILREKIYILIKECCCQKVRNILRYLYTKTTLCSSCLYRESMTIKHFITQLMHNIQYVDTIKIIKYLKVLQHVSVHRGSIIREPCTVLG